MCNLTKFRCILAVTRSHHSSKPHTLGDRSLIRNRQSHHFTDRYPLIDYTGTARIRIASTLWSA